MKAYLLFDLDGTLSDPIEGISQSLNFALESYGFEPLSEAEVAPHIGPPLDSIFRTITGVSDEGQLRLMVAKYRERFAEQGYRENRLYAGIKELLETLAEKGCHLGVCTSKREDFATRILRRFEIDGHFSVVSGGDIGFPKTKQIRELRGSGLVSERSWMIGDRAVDLMAAKENGLRCAAVLWGYGSRNELLSEDPDLLCEKPDDLLQLANAL